MKWYVRSPNNWLFDNTEPRPSDRFIPSNPCLIYIPSPSLFLKLSASYTISYISFSLYLSLSVRSTFLHALVSCLVFSTFLTCTRIPKPYTIRARTHTHLHTRSFYISPKTSRVSFHFGALLLYLLFSFVTIKISTFRILKYSPGVLRYAVIH